MALQKKITKARHRTRQTRRMALRITFISLVDGLVKGKGASCKSIF